MRRLCTGILTAVFFAALTVSGIQLCRLRAELEQEQTAFAELIPAEAAPSPSELSAVSAPAAGEPSETPAPENEERFRDLMERNGDFAAWLTVDGTRIDYPVMLTPAEPDYYLTHDFDGSDSHSGTPYIGKGCDTASDNIIIYGHNMKNGTMFADLLRYQDADFFTAHPTLRFDTPERSGEYEIIAVFREKLHYQDEQNVFRYYDYAGMLTEERFYAYADRIRELSLYDTGRSAVFGRQLITLSTCAYHTENGRFVVVAQKSG